MTFNDVLEDIAKLEGLKLESVRPGATIFVEEVDIVLEKIIVSNKEGKEYSRSFSEMKKIWEALISQPAVHVDEVLHGSGSSRNQPETIFANLPYIEWLKISNKKHIAYVGKNTHPYGTLKKMDGIQAANLADQISQKLQGEELHSVISTSKLSDTIKKYVAISGFQPEALGEKIYKISNGDDYFIFLDSEEFGLPEGTYAVMESKGNYDFEVEINSRMFGVVNIAGLMGLIKL